VTGVVTEAGTGHALQASVEAYRVDTMELFSSAETDTLAGGSYSLTLPYFNYELRVRSYHHIPAKRGITVVGPLTEDFTLDPTLANILVVDDNDGTKEGLKVDKSGRVLADDGDQGSREKSASQIASDLVDLGYDVTEETSSATDPGTWGDYDFIVWSDGDDQGPVSVATYRTALETYVAGGGKLLIEGGELAYDSASYPGYPSFAASVLHVSSWGHDSSGNVSAYATGHPVVSFPNAVTGLTMTYVNYGDEDASTPTSDAVMVCDWTGYPGLSSVVVYDDNADPASGQIVFYEFDYLAADAVNRLSLLEDTVTYLTAWEAPPTGGVRGMVQLCGETDHSGVTVTAYPGGASGTTGTTGEYEITGLYNGTYRIRATKAGWAWREVSGVTVSEGGTMGGVDMTLAPVSDVEVCGSPEVSIPDATPAGVYDTVTVEDELTVTEVEVYVNLTHTYIGDLIVELESPEGTTVRLHDETGSSDDNIVGWYEADLVVDGPGSLSDFAGESSAGEWQIWVSDNVGADTGVLHTWCVRVYGSSPTGVDDGTSGTIPRAYVLENARPNPFNPATVVKYGAPVGGPATLRVYNVAGRCVRTLVSGEVTAGYHEARWDGRDDGGAAVSSGVYFFRLEAPGYRGSTKAVLLK
jgi:subtilisin-like proprotein convertase family protein